MPTLSVTQQNVTVLSSQRTVLECILSNPDLSLQWVLYQNDGTRIPITFDERNFEEFKKRNIKIQSDVLNIELAFPYHNITITNADVSIHSGVYVCSIDTQREDPTFISRNITVNVLPGQLHNIWIATYIATHMKLLYTFHHMHVCIHIRTHVHTYIYT